MILSMGFSSIQGLGFSGTFNANLSQYLGRQGTADGKMVARTMLGSKAILTLSVRWRPDLTLPEEFLVPL